MSLRSHPTQVFGGLFLLAALATAFWLASDGGPDLEAVWAWLAAINAVTLLAYGLDKLLARGGAWRVPEAVLLGLGALGGTGGALAAMSLFRHKTIKGAFRVRFFVIAALQLAALLTWWFWPQLSGGG